MPFLRRRSADAPDDPALHGRTADEPRPGDAAPGQAAPDDPESLPAGTLAPEDPDRVLRHRLVFCLATLLLGSVFALFSSTLLSFAASGRLSLLFAAGAALLALGTLALIARAPLRAACAYRPENDELRSAAGFLSLSAGFLLIAADLVFLVFTLSVLLTSGGAAAFFVLPLCVLVYLSFNLLRESTDDFRKTVRLRRELTLFLTTLGYFVFVGFVFVVLAAAAVATPVSLLSPADGSTLCPGTPLDFSVNSLGLRNATWDNGSGPHDLPSPYAIDTTGWPDGPAHVTVTAFDATGAAHGASFNFTFSRARPPCP